LWDCVYHKLEHKDNGSSTEIKLEDCVKTRTDEEGNKEVEVDWGCVLYSALTWFFGVVAAGQGVVLTCKGFGCQPRSWRIWRRAGDFGRYVGTLGLAAFRFLLRRRAQPRPQPSAPPSPPKAAASMNVAAPLALEMEAIEMVAAKMKKADSTSMAALYEVD
jgi:hypothetical protein